MHFDFLTKLRDLRPKLEVITAIQPDYFLLKFDFKAELSHIGGEWRPLVCQGIRKQIFTFQVQSKVISCAALRV